MESLKRIVNKLTTKEIKIIKYFYKNENNKLLLLNLLLKKNVKTENEIAEFIYNKKGPAFSQLKSRLKNDILRVLLFFDDESFFQYLFD